MKLYPDQADAKNKIVDSIRAGNKHVMLCAPCAFGKTVLMCNIADGAISKGNRVWMIVDSTELISQTRRTLEEHGLRSAVIQGNHEDTDYKNALQVVTAQTLTRRWTRFDQNPDWLPDLIIVDEAHIQYKAHRELMGMLQDVVALGFSATPTSKGLGLVWDDLVIGSTVADMLDQDRLAPIKAFACYTPDMKGVRTSQGDYAIKQTEEKMNSKEIRGDIVSNWLRLGENRKTIVFAVNVKHSLDIANDFSEAGISSAQVDGRTNKALRAQIIEDFRNSDIKVLVSVAALIKGFDVTDIGCVIDAAPTKSLSRHIQKLGRGMRKNPVYKDCLVLDHGGNILRNGFPEEYLPDEMCTGKKKDADRKKPEEPLPKQCPFCGTLKPVKVHVCPACGMAPEVQSEIELVDGIMTEIKKKQTPAEKRNKEHTNERKQEFYSGILQIAKNRGNKPGWASNVYRMRYGVWPNARSRVAGPINEETRSFLRYVDIKNSHRRR